MKYIDLDINDMQMYAEKFKRSHDNKQRMIIISTPMHHESFFKIIHDTEIQAINIIDTKLDTSEFEKVFQSAIEKGCGIAIFKPSDDTGIHIEHIPNQEAFGISKASIKQLSFVYDCYPIEQLNSIMQEQLCDVLYEEQKLLIKPPKKKKTFQENFGYVKRKFR